MNSGIRFTSYLCTVLITVGFSLSGFHYHDERSPHADDNEVSIVHELDFCLLCEGISSEQPENPVSADGFIEQKDEISPVQQPVFSPQQTLIQNTRAPPVSG